MPSLVDRFGLIGTRDEVRQQIDALEKSGVNELLIQPVVAPETEMAELARFML
ncbi:hypothetical protein [Streptomyces olindensis]|uniref:hypothetical protein n=1 Tax=Streptomyces olindensis TaxID=358823 RepID=UPI000A508350